MPLSEQEKIEARDAIALALELNEPESLIESLKRLCQRKAAETGEWTQGRGYSLTSDNERQRWQSAYEALNSVASELERSNAPQTTAQAPGDAKPDN